MNEGNLWFIEFLITFFNFYLYRLHCWVLHALHNSGSC